MSNNCDVCNKVIDEDEVICESCDELDGRDELDMLPEWRLQEIEQGEIFNDRYQQWRNEY